MFVGHIALGLGAKRWVPSVGLGWLVAAPIAVDLVWPILVLTGIEVVRIVPGATAFNALVFESYPWSHSLLMVIGWGAALGGLARLSGISRSGSLVIAALVVSHWVLDLVTHVPDLPLWPGSPRFGLGLWNSVAGTLVVESALWITGIAIYLRAHPLRSTVTRVAFWSLVVVCTVTWGVSPWAEPPPSPQALGWFAMIGWTTIPWAALADRTPKVAA
jgi:hypothetical protein